MIIIQLVPPEMSPQTPAAASSYLVIQLIELSRFVLQWHIQVQLFVDGWATRLPESTCFASSSTASRTRFFRHQGVTPVIAIICGGFRFQASKVSKGRRSSDGRLVCPSGMESLQRFAAELSAQSEVARQPRISRSQEGKRALHIKGAQRLYRRTAISTPQLRAAIAFCPASCSFGIGCESVTFRELFDIEG